MLVGRVGDLAGELTKSQCARERLAMNRAGLRRDGMLGLDRDIDACSFFWVSQAKTSPGTSVPPEASPTAAPESSTSFPPAPASGMSHPPPTAREDKSPSEESVPTTSPESVSG